MSEKTAEEKVEEMGFPHIRPGSTGGVGRRVAPLLLGSTEALSFKEWVGRSRWKAARKLERKPGGAMSEGLYDQEDELFAALLQAARKHPDQRLGQLLLNVARNATGGTDKHLLWNMTNGELTRRLQLLSKNGFEGFMLGEIS